MRTLFANSWWSLVVRGLVAILVGLVTFAWPGITLTALVLVFGAYALVDGVMSIVGAWRAASSHERWGGLLIEGIAGIVAAVITVLWPAITAIALVYIVAAWALVTGVLEIVTAIRLRKYISGEWLLILAGIASILFGGILVIFPIAGALALALWFGIYAFIFGAVLVGLGIRLRTHAKTIDVGGSPLGVPTR